VLIVSFEVGWNLCYRSLYAVGGNVRLSLFLIFGSGLRGWGDFVYGVCRVSSGFLIIWNSSVLFFQDSEHFGKAESHQR